MRRIDVRLASMIWLLLASTAVAAPAQVFVDQGNIKYIGLDGVSHSLTNGGGYREPVLGPDDRTVIFIHDEGAAQNAEDLRLGSLWIGDGPTESTQRLATPHHSEDPSQNFDALSHPAVSPDLRFVFVCAAAWATDSAIHRIEIATGREQFVAAGNLISVVRTGPYRGDLLLERHTYNPAKRDFNYPIYMAEPNGKIVLRIPETGASAAQNQQRLAGWLKAHDWQAQ